MATITYHCSFNINKLSWQQLEKVAQDRRRCREVVHGLRFRRSQGPEKVRSFKIRAHKTWFLRISRYTLVDIRSYLGLFHHDSNVLHLLRRHLITIPTAADMAQTQYKILIIQFLFRNIVSSDNCLQVNNCCR